MSRKASRFLCLVALVAVFPKVACAAEPLMPDEDSRIRNPKLLTAGVVLLVSGLATAPLGLWVANQGGTRTCTLECSPMKSPPLMWFGLGIVASGIGAVLTSIPLMWIGATSVPLTVSGGPSGSTGLSLSATF